MIIKTDDLLKPLDINNSDPFFEAKRGTIEKENDRKNLIVWAWREMIKEKFLSLPTSKPYSSEIERNHQRILSHLFAQKNGTRKENFTFDFVRGKQAHVSLPIQGTQTVESSRQRNFVPFFFMNEKIKSQISQIEFLSNWSLLNLKLLFPKTLNKGLINRGAKSKARKSIFFSR